MQVDDKLLQKLEHLSALNIPQNEREGCIAALSEVLNFANILTELDTTHLAKKTEEFTPLREDEIKTNNISENVLMHAPARDKQYFSVPKIIE